MQAQGPSVSKEAALKALSRRGTADEVCTNPPCAPS